MLRNQAHHIDDVGLTVFLVVLVLCLFVLYPLTTPAGWGHQVISLGFSLILVTAVLAIFRQHSLRLAALVTMAGSLSSEWLAHFVDHDSVEFARHGSSIVFLSLATYGIFIQVLRPGRITPHRVRGAIAVYLLLGLIWAQAYALVDLVVPDSFHPSIAVADMSDNVSPPRSPQGDNPAEEHHMATLVYFSYVTLATLGYGDVSPVSGPARSLAVLEALVGQLYLAILIARLVSLQIAHSDGKD